MIIKLVSIERSTCFCLLDRVMHREVNTIVENTEQELWRTRNEEAGEVSLLFNL